jgi:hypothetical protein
MLVLSTTGEPVAWVMGGVRSVMIDLFISGRSKGRAARARFQPIAVTGHLNGASSEWCFVVHAARVKLPPFAAACGILDVDGSTRLLPSLNNFPRS